MEELISKLTSYNLFNYLFPGTIFAIFVEEFTQYSFIYEENLIFSLFLFYLLGSLISRVGSLILEPLLEKIRFIEREPYHRFKKAQKNDNKLEKLSEQNNVYRNLSSLFLIMLIMKGIDAISLSLSVLLWIGMVLLLIVFLFSYRKQTEYITSGIRFALGEENKNDE